MTCPRPGDCVTKVGVALKRGGLHTPGRQKTIGALPEFGRADGSFPTDVPADWLVTACIAVNRSWAGEVRMDERHAARILTVTITDLFRPNPIRAIEAAATLPVMARAASAASNPSRKASLV